MPTRTAAPVPPGERTLFEARATIKRLRAQLKATAPNTSGELRMSADPLVMVVPPKIPAGTRPIAPPPSDPHPTPHPGSPIPEDYPGQLGAMPPKMLAKFLEERTTSELHKLLSAENSRPRKEHNPHLAMSIYREIKKRK